ncbi:MAG TPA: YhfC family glutamic-type intramembrane protease [Rhizomicrobium sp.]|nr:YhfC family glutamic-type intramembrane protease [Rhizomicrobium sp.]
MTVSTATLAGLALGALMSLAGPIVVYLVCRGRMTLGFRNVALGAATFLVFALALEGLANAYVLRLNPVTAGALRANAWAFALYAAGAAALFEETGRFLALRFLAARAEGPGPAVSYAIGHGGLEAAAIGFGAQISTLALALLLNAGGLNSAMAGKMSAPALVALHERLTHLSFAVALAGGLERLWALLAQIALSLVVWRAVQFRQWRWLALAYAAHLALDYPPALYLKRVVSFALTESVIAAVGIALLGVFLARLPPRARRA